MTIPAEHGRRKTKSNNPFAAIYLAAENGRTVSESHPSEPLKLPDVAGLSLLDAALAYAEAGWYVLPTDPTDIKNPGSVVRGKWHEKSSRDPDEVRRWWRANPNYGIALHCGRSGAGVFDLDVSSVDALRVFGRDDLADALLGAETIQGTRPDGDRCHYIFLLPTGDGKEYGNSAGAFAIVGQFRGKNGVIIAAPTPHPDAETKNGEYNQRKTGAVGVMPKVLRDCLSEAGDSADPLTDAELTAFLDTNTGGGCGREDCRHEVAGPVANFNAQVEENASRYETLVKVAPWAFSEATAGCYSARELTEALCSAYEARFSPADGDRLGRVAGEFQRVMSWAAAQADPNRAHRNDDLLTEDELEAFWTARPELARLHTFARARCAGPWSTLGAVLARVVATIPPHVVLPPTVGSHASLNLFVALVAPSGFGKGASEAVAEDFLTTKADVFVATPGSGEGILKQYAYKKKDVQFNLRNAVILSVPEIDTFAALASRGGSTLMPELRKAWMGERLGFGWADVEKAVAVMPHRYRMTMIVGVQPGRGGALLQDSDGGTPQRFVWLPTTDRAAPDEPPSEPEPLVLPEWPASRTDPGASASSEGDREERPRLKLGSALDQYKLNLPPDKSAFHVLRLPPTVVDAIRLEHLAKRRGEVAEAKALDSHAMLARLKIAVGLMWLNGRTDKVSDEDWELGGVVLGVSNAARASVVSAMKSNTTKAAKARGRQDAVREVAKAEQLAKTEDAAVSRVAERIRKALRSENDQPKAAMKRDFGRDKKHFDTALERLVGVGDVELQPIPGKSDAARTIHLKEGR